MTEDRREEPFRISARYRVRVGVADTGRLDLDQHLPGPWPFDVDRLDGERLSCLPGHRGAGFHFTRFSVSFSLYILLRGQGNIAHGLRLYSRAAGDTRRHRENLCAISRRLLARE